MRLGGWPGNGRLGPQPFELISVTVEVLAPSGEYPGIAERYDGVVALHQKPTTVVDDAERRVYRLAALLTGDQTTAARVLDDVLAEPGRLKRLDGAHLDRLTVLRCREQKSGPFAEVAGEKESAAALVGMDAQPREAWIMSHVYSMQPRDAARAMDCSVTALNLHLNRAHAVMHERLGEQGARRAAERLASRLKSMDVPVEIVRLRERRHRMRRAVRWLWMVCVTLGVLAVLAWGASQWLK